MKMLNENTGSKLGVAHWGWLLPILALAPLSLAAKGCNSAVVGNDCPEGATNCTSNSGGSGGSGAAGPGGPGGTVCGTRSAADCGDGEFCSFAPSAQCGAADQGGVCKTKPEVCADIYAPVCGCDGKTYSSDCSANGAGVSVASQGECTPGGGGGGDVCGGLQGLECGAGEYCNFATAAQCGSGDQTGICAAKPRACDASYVPVCGCDDKTYGNSCAAASAGVSVAYTGECGGPAGEACGTRGGTICGTGQYCSFPPGADCGRSDAPGECTDILQGGCLANYDPVCGCDGNTYSNACAAGVRGVSVDYEGECGAPPSGDSCGGFIGAQCDEGFFCNYPPDMACGISDGSGTCSPIPSACDLIYSPVCGCDGKTYGNACAASSAGVSVAAQGECAP